MSKLFINWHTTFKKLPTLGLECCWHFPTFGKTLDSFALAIKALILCEPNTNMLYNTYRKFHKEAIPSKNILSARLYSSSSQPFMVCGPLCRLFNTSDPLLSNKFSTQRKIINLLLLRKNINPPKSG